MNPVGTHASRPALLDRPARTTGVSTTGLVFGIARIAVKPPAAAARVPDADVLLVLVAGCAQVDVRVDEARQEHEAVGLDRLELCAVEVRPDLGDHALVDADVERVTVEPRCRVDDAGAGDQEVGGRSGRAGEPLHHATSCPAAETTSGETIRSAASESALPGPARRS